MTKEPVSQLRTDSGSSDISGAGMDRVIANPQPWWRRWGIVAGSILLLVGVLFFGRDLFSGSTFHIENSRIVVAPVTSGKFDDFIPIRGRVTPLKTVYLDAIEGGQVQRRYVEDGATVNAGDLIVSLGNTTLQLDVTRNEAMVTEQLNNMRSIELQLEQNRLQHKRNLVEIDYQIQRLGRQVERLSNLDIAGVAAKSQLEDSEDELAYYNNRRAVTLESQATDARLQETQLAFLRTSSTQLEESLVLARQNLDALNVRAPVPGKLSGLDVEIGQSIQRGGRLGQIDDPNNFKLRVAIDEFYLNRVDIGQAASMENEPRFELEVGKIYPQVKDGQFELDLHYLGEQPANIRRGQTIQATLTLGDSADALLVPNGTFFQDTGGNWMFVLNDDGTEANKRPVRLGRRNSEYIEVLDGLAAGERVITSAYSAYREMDRLTLSAE
ncbi:MAG: HlyD family efflux transporter periplasmic adaptor subunit [Pseudomonadales bacterium]|nr:HlyD family efflux transporter periplasmic adaptor subunit [Pseudomonadales bacterium]